MRWGGLASTVGNDLETRYFVAMLSEAAVPPGSENACSLAGAGDLFIPETVLGYRVLRLTSGSGGEGDLFVAQGADNQQVAVKIYRRSLGESIGTSRVLAELPRNRLLVPLERGDWHGRLVEVMPYLPEGSLAELIKKGPLPSSEVRRLLTQIREGLEQLHRAGIQHRDLKSTNILIQRREPLEIVLADFGCAAIASETVLTAGRGTLFYSAPESLTGMYSEASDYWSLGIILLEALTGNLISAIWRSDRSLPYKIIQGKVPIPESVPKPWYPVLKGLLDRDHYRRWRAAEIRSWLDRQRDTDLKPVSRKPRPILISILIVSLVFGGIAGVRLAMVKEPESRPAVVHKVEPGMRINPQVLPSTVTQSGKASLTAARIPGWMVNSITAVVWFLAIGSVLMGIAHVLGGVPHGTGAIFLGLLIGIGAYYLPRLLG
jgi:serine/threonine protein kinase